MITEKEVDDAISQLLNKADKIEKPLHYSDAPEMSIFLNSKENLLELAKKLKPVYLGNVHYNDTSFSERLTPLEIIAKCVGDKLEHLEALISITSEDDDPKRPRRINVFSTTHPTYAFFRALSEGNIDIASRLLQFVTVQKAASDIKIKLSMDEDINNMPEGLYTNTDYFHRITKVEHYREAPSQLRYGANVALIMAAESNNTAIFNQLLEIERVKEQLPMSAILVFITATTIKGLEPNTRNLSLNRDIIYKLLEIPRVFSYASLRPLYFGYLVEEFQKIRLQQLRKNKTECINMDPNAAKLCVYILANLIKIINNPKGALAEIAFLLDIPAVQDIAHNEIVLSGEPNQGKKRYTLLEWAIKQVNPKAMTLLMTKCPKVAENAANNKDDGYSPLLFSTASDRRPASRPLQTTREESIATELINRVC